MSLTQWGYNGKTYELDLGDADVAERYEKAFTILEEKEKQMPKDGTNSARIRAYVALFVELYDLLFYRGAGREILPKDSITYANQSYESFLEFANKQTEAAQNSIPDMLNKYSPNRAQRRGKSK